MSSSLSESAAPSVLLAEVEAGRAEDEAVGEGPLLVGALRGLVGTAVPALDDEASTGAVVSGLPVATSFKSRRPRAYLAASSVKTSK